jgi:hypothetical protein
MFAFPRTPVGSTGAAAAKEYAPITSRGMLPPSFPMAGTTGANVETVAYGDPNGLHLGSFHNLTYGWNVAKSIASPISIDMVDLATPFGRTYNLGITKNQGNPLDTANVLIDATGGWPSSSGSNTECLLLPLNGGPETLVNYGTNRLGSTYGTSGGAILAKPIAIGDTVFISSNAGVHTYSQASGQGGTTSLIYTNSSGVYDLLYDGKRTLYGAISNGVVTIDTETYAANTIVGSIGEGTNWLAADNKYVYVTASRASNTAPRIYAIYRSNNVLNASNSFLPGTAFATVSWFSQPIPDYLGNCFVSQLTTATTATVKRIYKFSQDNLGGGALVATDPSAAGYTNRQVPGFPSQFIYDFIGNKLFYFHDISLTTACVYDYNPSSFAILGNSTTTFSHSSSNGFAFANNVTSGQHNIIPHKGVWWFSPQKYGTNVQVAANRTHYQRLLTNSPNATTTTGNVQGIVGGVDQNNLGISATPLGAASHQWTNGTTIFATTSVTTIDNRIYVIDNLYPTFHVSGHPTGRLVLKG